MTENADEVFKKLQEGGIDPVLFGLTDEGYEALSRTLHKYVLICRNKTK